MVVGRLRRRALPVYDHVVVRPAGSVCETIRSEPS
jgi:hypothetical protein